MAALLNISSPSGEKSATASSRFSITDSNSVELEVAGSALLRTADSWALTASNELPRSRELLSGQVEPHVELAAAEARQPALDDVNRPQHPLRQERRDHRRDGQRDERRIRDVLERLDDLRAHEQRRHADANRAEVGVAGQDLLAELVAALLVHEPELLAGPRRRRCSSGLRAAASAGLRASGVLCATALPLVSTIAA